MECLFRGAESEHGDRIARGAGRADDGQRSKYVDEHPGFALDESFERHAFVEMYAVLHDQVLVARVEYLGVDRGNDFDREIVGTDDADLQARKPARAFEP